VGVNSGQSGVQSAGMKRGERQSEMRESRAGVKGGSEGRESRAGVKGGSQGRERRAGVKGGSRGRE
jgi:hypothetical protein